MDENEAALFMATLAALQSNGGSASKGFIESAEPMTATCTVKRTE
jgi:hypothetical protein